MVNSLEPIKVDINVENPSLQREAFYNLCFITNNDVAPRTLEVKTLSDLLDNGYTRLDLAYNFCVGVFSQEGISSVFLRAKRSDESYIDAYQADDNSEYYYVIIESKEYYDIIDFNDYLNSNKELKLQFYSNKIILNDGSPNLVNYYQNYEPLLGSLQPDDVDYYLNEAYRYVGVAWASKPYPVLVEKEDAYKPTVKPLNITLRRILKDITIDSDAYQPNVRPLDMTLRSLLMRKDIDDNDAYMPSVKPLDITLKSLLMSKNINSDAYQPSVKPLDITLKRIMIEQHTDDNDAYMPSVKPLDITLKAGV